MRRRGTLAQSLAIKCAALRQAPAGTVVVARARVEGNQKRYRPSPPATNANAVAAAVGRLVLENVISTRSEAICCVVRGASGRIGVHSTTT